MLDPISSIDKVSIPIQFHFGKFDKIVLTSRLLYEKANQPKEVYWYNAGHEFPLTIVAERALKWFRKYLI